MFIEVLSQCFRTHVVVIVLLEAFITSQPSTAVCFGEMLWDNIYKCRSFQCMTYMNYLFIFQVYVSQCLFVSVGRDGVKLAGGSTKM